MTRTLTLSVLCAALGGCRDEPAKNAPAPEVTTPTTRRSSVCDEEALRRVAKEIESQWSSWTPATGTIADHSVEAIKAVWDHCPGLNDAVRHALDVGVHHPPDPELVAGCPLTEHLPDPIERHLPGHARLHDIGEELRLEPKGWDWLACRDIDSIRDSITGISDPVRAGIVYDHCLEPIGLLSRVEYVVSYRAINTFGLYMGLGGKGVTPSFALQLTGFSMFNWLRRSGVDDEVARTLGRAMVFNSQRFIRPADGVLLPTVASAEPLHEMMILDFHPRCVHFTPETSVRLDDTGRPVPATLEGTPSYYRSIQFGMLEEADKGTQLALNQNMTWEGEVLVVAHRDTPWATVRPALAAARAVGFSRMYAAVLVDDRLSPERRVLVHDEQAKDEPMIKLSDETTVQQLVDIVVARSTPPRTLKAGPIRSPEPSDTW